MDQECLAYIHKVSRVTEMLQGKWTLQILCAMRTEYPFILLGDVPLRLLSLLAANADDGSENADTFLPCVHTASEILPRPEPGDAGCGRHLRSTHTLPMFL